MTKRLDMNEELTKGAGEAGIRERISSAPKFKVVPEEQLADLTNRPPEYTDDALARRFEDKHSDHLRFVAAWSRWFVFNGKRWEPDETKRVFNLARQVCREAAAEAIECDKKRGQRIASVVSSAKTVSAVLTMAQSEPRIAATTDQWDADPWLLNTPGGVVDLRNGEMREHRADNYLSKITSIAPNPNCSIQNWLAFLDRVTGKDADLIAFLQRMAGYALTGVTVEHAMFFLYGRGANGKTTFLNATTDCEGDYHRTSSIETFTETKNERHPTELASLRGARTVTATETAKGRRWAENKIKALTGGDKIAARFMRQDFFEFTPQFKLVIAGNHKPTLKTVDEAIKRRFHLVPFNVTIPKDERDHKLKDKLQGELPGVLSWMIKGCTEWQKIGLAPPKVVTEATEAYLEAEDAIGAWIDECCIRDPKAETNRALLHANWANWATQMGERLGETSEFWERLEEKGFDHRRRKNMRIFRGIRFRVPSDPPREECESVS